MRRLPEVYCLDSPEIPGAGRMRDVDGCRAKASELACTQNGLLKALDNPNLFAAAVPACQPEWTGEMECAHVMYNYCAKLQKRVACRTNPHWRLGPNPGSCVANRFA